MSTAVAGAPPPIPPRELAARVVSASEPDPNHALERIGRSARELVRSALPVGWSFAGKHVLDFGCGPGTLLRQFLDEAASAQFVGCDIHEPSIAWLEQTLCPPLHVLVNGEAPPLAFPEGHFDLILAISVFGHITDHWSGWLVELHRLLDDDGVMIATLMGEGMSEAISGQPWSPETVGMNVFEYCAGFAGDSQGPMVLHSPWWVESHWGRIFEVEILDYGGPGRHMALNLRKKLESVSVEELERPDPAEPREATAMLEQIRQLRRELRDAVSEHHR